MRACSGSQLKPYALNIFSDAVDTMVERGLAKTRTEAVELGRMLARELGLFRHVTGDHAFSDDYLFFRFCDNPAVTATPALHGRYDLPTLAEIGEAEGAGGSEDSSAGGTRGDDVV